MEKFKKGFINLFKDKKFIVMLISLVVLIIIAVIVYNKRYSPTNETMTLNDYYEVQGTNMAVITDGTLVSSEEDATAGIVRNNQPYVKVKLINNTINDVYAYDSAEHVVMYTTTEGTYSAKVGQTGYTYNGSNNNTEYQPVIEENGVGYLNLEFVKASNGIDYTFNTDPNRAAIYTAGTERTTATIKKDSPMRRFGGSRSKIVATATEGEEVTVVENYGSWSQILTDKGELGCVENGILKNKETSKNKSGAAQESLPHNLMSDKVRLGWHQVFNTASNADVNQVVSTAKGMNVISPTWLQISNNKGGLNNLSSTDYVNYCHNNGIRVWALVSNIEKDVDEAQLFNVTSNRQALVNNIINAAVAASVDGINIDMESVGTGNVDGYTEFIKEMALQCKSKNLVLSVDNYNVKSADYNVDIQARYADYVVLFGYDEHWTGGGEAGSNASINFVKESVEGMIAAGVDNKQLILGIPFYTRLWIQTSNGLDSKTVTLKDTPALISSNNAQTTWLKDKKQNYAEWTTGDAKNMIWIEDDESLQEKCSYVADKKLVGIAAWKLGNENESTWNMITQTVK